MSKRKNENAADIANTPKKRRWRPTRRGFLIGAGVTAGVGAAGLAFGLPYAQLRIAGALDGAGAPFSVDAEPLVWFEINPDNTITFHSPKVEMGQGIHTSLKQIAIEELEVEWEQMNVVQARTQRGPNDGGGTGASASVSGLYVPLREAGATLREMLRGKAAEKLGVPASDLTLEAGIFTAPDGQMMAYSEVIEGVTEWEVPEEAPALKPRSQFKFIGKTFPRIDFEAKLTGDAVYGYDVRLPDMLYGSIVRPSTIEGKMVSAEIGSAKERNGVVDVVIEDDLVAVLATSRIEADTARGGLDIVWDDGKLWQHDEIIALSSVGMGDPTVIQKVGDSKSMLDADTTISAEYRTPMAAHAHLEPQAAVVDYKEDRVVARVSTQFPDTVRGDIAEALGVDEEIVDMQASYLGGGFGRKLNTNAAIEAARLSKAVGKPVSVGWNRREEFRNGYVRPPTHNVFRAQLDANGNMLALEHEQASGDVAFPFFPSIAIPVLGADFGAWRGSRIQYNVPNLRTVAHRTPLPIATGWWRGLGLLANTFALESFIDEVAHSAGRDPLEFRLAHLSDEGFQAGYRGVLEAVAERADWGKVMPEGRAQGIAASVDVGTFCAMVAEVSVENGNLRVHKITTAIDPGVIINPDGVLAQTQGSIIMGLSSAFFEEIKVKDGKIEATNFDRYPLITMKEAPELDTVLLENGDSPNGMGEPAMGPAVAAVANAAFALTGQRLRDLPLKLA